jgi:hypothetical protein
MIERIKKYGVVALIVALVLVFVARCSTQPKPLPPAAHVLAPNEAERLIIQDHKLITVTPKGSTVQYVPPEGTTTISIDKKGKATVHVQAAGFTHHLGGGIIYADRLRGTLDIEGYFLARFGAHIGIGIANGPVLMPYAALSYRLDQVKLPNTSLVLARTLNYWGVGLRVAF